jgi:hypothetical protein
MLRMARYAALASFLIGAPSGASAVTLSLDQDDFALTDTYNRVVNFRFDIEIAGALVAGRSYANPALSALSYQIQGDLRPDGSPSGFPGFLLVRPASGTMSGAEFYALQSTEATVLRFDIRSDADLSDGLQVSELATFSASVDQAGDNPTTFANLVFLLNAREEGTGRFHPALFTLFGGGAGRLQNSNNIGGDNPSDSPDAGQIDVDFGDEYIADLTFDPGAATLAAGTLGTVPLPPGIVLLGSCCLLLVSGSRAARAAARAGQRRRSAG